MYGLNRLYWVKPSQQILWFKPSAYPSKPPRETTSKIWLSGPHLPARCVCCGQGHRDRVRTGAAVLGKPQAHHGRYAMVVFISGLNHTTAAVALFVGLNHTFAFKPLSETIVFLVAGGVPEHPQGYLSDVCHGVWCDQTHGSV